MNRTTFQDFNFPIDGYAGDLYNGDGYSAIEKADPLVYKMLNWFAYVLERDLGAAWTYYTNKAGLTSCNKIVGMKNFIPLEIISESIFATFPVISLEPVSGNAEHDSFGHIITKTKFNFIFIMPSLIASKYNTIYPFIRAVDKVINTSLRLSYDQAYLDGYEQINADVLWQETNTEYGTLALGDERQSKNYPCLKIEFEVIEKEYTVSEEDDLEISNVNQQLDCSPLSIFNHFNDLKISVT
jgi:hypothetical protein